MEYYVNAAAKCDGDGSRERPYRYINDAAKVAGAGDEVIVAPGIYREYVNPVHGGTKEAPVVYRSEKPLGAVITGAELLTGWKKYKGQVWTTSVDNGIFGAYHPYTAFVYGDWYFSDIIRHTGSIFLNDLAMYEVMSLKECMSAAADEFAWNAEESKFKWYTEQDGNRTVFYANFRGKDPNKEKVEFTVRRNCFMPEKEHVDYITVRGFNINKAATTWAPPAAYQDGMIGPHWSMGWIIEDCEVYGSRCVGISLGKYLDPENDMYFTTKWVKSPTQMERDAVCRGQYHGWKKERIGHHIVRRCNIHHCEQGGIVGRMGGVFSVIEDNHIHHICNSSQLRGAETAGIKLHAAIDVTIRRNHIHHSIIGVWLDWEAQGARVSQNFMHDNHRPAGVKTVNGIMFNADVFVEVGHGPTLIDNNLLLSKVSVTIPSEGIACVHNLFLGSFSLINSGVDSEVNGQREPRYTPYHIRHRTEVAGFMTILHGDDRIYNNIFIQHYKIEDKKKTPKDADYMGVGTKCFDIFPTYEEWIKLFKTGKRPDMGALANAHFGHLPVWIKGNAYFSGANMFKKEKEKYVDKTHKIRAEVVEKNGEYTFETNVYTYLKDFCCGMITSDVLGKAFEPEQRFESPDGTEIIFNRDYFGDHRGTGVLPGPFAKGASRGIYRV
ncbi:MAG: right-handed parallel beta-helix repeat-containing protein [Lachnospiraceae bacterium]|nr:right-handed parallel beta-helix repeat-containing protein [Lachnospiraceae bacterium]